MVLTLKLESLLRPVPVCGGYGWKIADMPYMHSPQEIILTLEDIVVPLPDFDHDCVVTWVAQYLRGTF